MARSLGSFSGISAFSSNLHTPYVHEVGHRFFHRLCLKTASALYLNHPSEKAMPRSLLLPTSVDTVLLPMAPMARGEVAVKLLRQVCCRTHTHRSGVPVVAMGVA